MAASLATCVTQQRAPAAAGQRGSWWLDARSLAGVERGHAVGMEISHDHQSAVVAAVDVHYLGSGGARAAVVLASDASFSVILAERTVLVPEVAPYHPGQFFLRELPPVRAVLAP